MVCKSVWGSTCWTDGALVFSWWVWFRKQIKSADLGKKSSSPTGLVRQRHWKIIYSDFSRAACSSFQIRNEVGHTERPLVNARWPVCTWDAGSDPRIAFRDEGWLSIDGNTWEIFILYILWTKDGILAYIQNRRKEWAILWLTYLSFKPSWPLVSETVFCKPLWLSQGLTVTSVTLHVTSLMVEMPTTTSVVLTLELEPKRKIIYNFTINSTLLMIFYKYYVHLLFMSSYFKN